MNWKEQGRGDGQVPENDKYYEYQDYECEQGVYESGQDIAQYQYLPGYIDPGYQAGVTDDRAETGGGAGVKELPGHNTHQQVYDEILLTTPEMPEDEVQDQRQQKRAEQGPEKAEKGILVAIFQVGCGQIPD